MLKMIKCSTGGMENKIIKRQDLKPLETSQLLLQKFLRYEYFQFPITNFAPLFSNQVEKEDFYLSYFRENKNNIDVLLNQPSTGNSKIATFTSTKVLDLYKKMQSE